MAALLPPPKRQKLHNGVPEPEPQKIVPAYNVVVQFVSEDDGQSFEPAIYILQVAIGQWRFGTPSKANNCSPWINMHIGLQRLPWTRVLLWGQVPLIIQARNPPLMKKVCKTHKHYPLCELNAIPQQKNSQKSASTNFSKIPHISHTLPLVTLLIISSSTRSSNKPITRLTGHQRQIFHVAFSPDSRLAASSSWDNSVRIWEGKMGKFIATLRGHVGPVYRVAWSADERLLVSASKDLKTYKI